MTEPRAFCGLLARILPVNIRAEITDKKVYKTLDQLRQELQARGIPVDEMVAEERANKGCPVTLFATICKNESLWVEGYPSGGLDYHGDRLPRSAHSTISVAK